MREHTPTCMGQITEATERRRTPEGA